MAKKPLVCKGDVCVDPDTGVITVLIDRNHCTEEAVKKLTEQLMTGDADARWKIVKK